MPGAASSEAASEMTTAAREQMPAPPEPARFRRVMGQFASGVTVVTAALESDVRGMTATAFFSGSLTPPLCVVSVANKARIHAVLRQAKRFAVNILSHDQQDVALHFAGRATHSRQAVDFGWIDGVPLLGGALGHIACDRIAEHACGDHTLFVGSIFHMAADEAREPLLHHRGHFGTMHHSREDDAVAVPEFW
jgi:flavin reductase (DIM6/NTAB) family NADH-FMN oxidoreductase RutF